MNISRKQYGASAAAVDTLLFDAELALFVQSEILN